MNDEMDQPSEEGHGLILALCLIAMAVILWITATTGGEGCENYEVDQRGNVCLPD